MRGFLLQMAGDSGTGKSTLALAIGEATGAVVVDKDVIKARMLDDGLTEDTAGPLSYAVFFDLGAALLSQGHSVVLDSPASFIYIRDRGRCIAEANCAAYYIIRCCLPDVEAIQKRLDSRIPVASQPRVAAFDTFVRPGTGPLTEPHVTLDTRRPFDEYLAEALAYIGHGPG
jgi:predicted kinase